MKGEGMIKKISLDDFNPVWDAAGARNFFMQGYPHHKMLRPLGLDLSNSTFVAKTMTLEPRKGNMRIRKDGTLPWWNPKPGCIVVNFREEAVLNAVGLSNSGMMALFEDGRWQEMTEPFFLSFTALYPTAVERKMEIVELAQKLKRELPRFKAPAGLQLNYSCPNVKGNPGHALPYERLAEEISSHLGYLGDILEIPLVVKLSVQFPVSIAKEIAEHPACAGLCVSNTIPWDALEEYGIDRVALFGSKTSPLARYGGGGLSGKPLLPLVEKWVREARKQGITKHINAGGGILKPEDVGVLYEAGASSVFLGSIAILHPLRVKETVTEAYVRFLG